MCACVTRQEHLPNTAQASAVLALVEVSTEITPESYARQDRMRTARWNSLPQPCHNMRQNLALTSYRSTILEAPCAACCGSWFRCTQLIFLYFAPSLHLFLVSPATPQSFTRTSAGAAQPAASTVGESMAILELRGYLCLVVHHHHRIHRCIRSCDQTANEGYQS